MDLGAAQQSFLFSLVNRSPATITNYSVGLRKMNTYLAEQGIKLNASTYEIPVNLLEEFFVWLRSNGSAKSSAVTLTHAASSFVDYLERRDLLAPKTTSRKMRYNLLQVTGKITQPRKNIDNSAAKLVTHVMALPALNDPALNQKLLRDKALLATLYSTGMRRKEVCDLNRGTIINGAVEVIGKGERDRTVFLDDAALDAIRAYLDDRKDKYLPMFLRHDDGRGQPGPKGEHWRLSPQSVWGVVKAYAADMDITVTTHDFRHLKARVLLNKGAGIAEVADILGHANLNTTKRIYAAYTNNHIRSAFHRYSASPEEVLADAGDLL